MRFGMIWAYIQPFKTIYPIKNSSYIPFLGIIKNSFICAAYFAEHYRPLLVDYLAEEHRRIERIIFQNVCFTALVPFWAVWPFEILLVAHRLTTHLSELTATEVSALAETLKQVTKRYDNLFEISFLYSMGFHQAPSHGLEIPKGLYSPISIRSCYAQP